ncbi:MAG: hypothetical protein JW910_13115 [Anaerolineae bacterium]|nr:hypothetical protein [Anaerolineae bacterium]
MPMDEHLIAWLLEGDPWVQYRAWLDLLGQSESDPQVQAARQAMIDHPQVRRLVTDLADWPGPALKSHKDAKHPLHKLVFAADLGLRVGDPDLDLVIERTLDHQSSEGPFTVLSNIPTHFGGSGTDEWHWMLCDAPLIVYALAAFGLEDDPRVREAAAYLVGLIRKNGWPCATSPGVGTFRGPGRKTDPCPYATLIMLRMLAALPGGAFEEEARAGVETLLDLWARRTDTRPYLFGMGTDFSKLKAPLIWYDVLHVLDVLTRFSWTHEDHRLREMVALVREKADPDGRFTPESVWMAWKDWEFGQKRAPSRWLTLLAQRIIARIGDR